MVGSGRSLADPDGRLGPAPASRHAGTNGGVPERRALQPPSPVREKEEVDS